MVFVRAAGRHYRERRSPGAGACCTTRPHLNRARRLRIPTRRRTANFPRSRRRPERTLNSSVRRLWSGCPIISGISAAAGYWLFVFINFAIIAGFIYWASRTSLAQAFRHRTAAIQKGLEEARRASTEANARLQEVQARLSKLDLEVAAIRAAADADFSAEEQRIKLAAEEDARRVIETGESEITAAAKNARRELKIYAAELAVELAKKEIKVDPQADAALVRDFVSQLGKDGK